MEDFQKSEIFLIGKSGEVLARFPLSSDGPNAVRSPKAFGLFDGKIAIMDSQKGFLMFSDTGEITDRIEIPAPYFYVSTLRTPLFDLGDDLAYIRPERGKVDYSSRLEMFRKTYSSPILEVFDPASQTARNTMPFPPETIYQDGNFYHWTYPHIVKNGKEWLLQLLGELKYHVYHQVEGEILFQHTVDLDVKDAVPILGVPFEKMDDLYELWKHIYFGKIENLFVLDECILVQYTRGVKEETVRQYDRSNPEGWAAFMQIVDQHIAVLDKSHQVLQKDIPVPKGLVLTKVINDNDEILALKNQDYFGVEEDHVTFYMLKLKQ
jgi:hypothetical protein